MASRPVYVPMAKAPFVDVFYPEFAWNGGFATSQKQKNIVALHNAFHARFSDRSILEISSKSLQSLGAKLSAFFLQKYVPALGHSIPLECAFQGGKVFFNGGPFMDLYAATPREAKRDPRLRDSGPLLRFTFDGKDFPLRPRTAFYNWLYINALMENPNLAEEVLQFDAFTDIEFNPDKSLNCQAEAAALFVALHRQGLSDRCKDFGEFLLIMDKTV